MPMASTSQILGNNEGLEPYTSNIFTQCILTSNFVVINNHLVKDLMELGLWMPEMKNHIICDGGLVAKILEILAHLHELYKTVWEISLFVSMTSIL